MMRRFALASFCLGLAVCFGSSIPTRADQEPCPHHDAATQDAVADQNPQRYVRSVTTYRTPDITLLDQEGKAVDLTALLEGSEPVALNFIFTSCATVCPIMTATFSQMHRALKQDAAGLHTVSISIDPEHDTPPVLKSYAKRFNAAPAWRFLTGDAQDILQVQKAFDAYTGNKANHRPFTLFKAADATSWVRIDGLASGAELAAEYRRLREE